VERDAMLSTRSARLFCWPLVGVSLTLPIWVSLVQAAQPQEIDASIQKGADYLYSRQRDGVWEADDIVIPNPTGMHQGGLTAIATYALLAAGEDPNSPKLAKAIEYLKQLQTTNAYVLGMRAQVWRYLPRSPQTHQLIARDSFLLLDQIKAGADARGLFSYPKTGANIYDHSISQFGVLGLWAGAQSGADVPPDVWSMMDRGWRVHQHPTGGWSYSFGGKASPDWDEDTLSMTSAALASLLIISDYKSSDADIAPADPNIDRGLKWITDNFGTLYQGDARQNMARWYTLYAIERIGVAGGYKYFGTTNWFTSGADYLLKSQNPDGSWASGLDLWGYNDGNIPDTCFSILFFIHGRAPVVINKLSYINTDTEETALWNARPRDIANLTRWAGKQVESLLNWHIVTLAAPLPELHDAPILFISGAKPLTFSDDQINKLREFVEEGGMIVANADDGARAFVESIKKLGSKLFPMYEFRALSANHVLYTSEQFPANRFKTKPRVLGLSNGVRELILLIPDQDASRVWQTHLETSDLYPLGSDIIQYATDKKGLDEGRVLRHYQYKPLASFVAEPDATVTAARTISVARLQYTSNWNPEPGGWRRLGIILHNQFKTDLNVGTVKLGAGQLISPPAPAGPAVSPDELRKTAFGRIPPDQIMATGGDHAKLDALVDQKVKELQAAQAAAHPAPTARFQLAHVTGTTAFQLTEPQRQEIKRFIDSGGTLVIDAAGGSSAFSSSAEKELAAIFGAEALDKALSSTLPIDDPLFNQPNAKIDSIEYRTFTKRRLGALKSPQICGIQQNGRTAVYYSRLDLSAGLVGQQVDGIDGYDPDSATAIMRNIVLIAGSAH
jgi:hypothetical protein